MPVIIDTLKALPGVRACRKRQEEDIELIVIHHDAAPPPQPGKELLRIKNEARYHIRKRGFPCLAYHFWIDQHGEVWKCNPLTDITPHARGANSTGIGIALSGNFDYSVPSQLQLAALRSLVKALRKAYPWIKAVLPHRLVKLSSTACPGKYLSDALIARL